MKTNKLITLSTCCLVLTVFAIMPIILNRIFPSSENFEKLYTITQPYALYIIVPILSVFLLYMTIFIWRLNVISKGFDKESDIIRMCLFIIWMILISAILTILTHFALSKYAPNYAGNLFNIKEMKTLIWGLIFFVLLLWGYFYGNLLAKREKWSNLEDINSLIKKWESLTLEFKQTFFLDVKKKHEEEYIKKESLKNIAWFLNKDWWTLLIWVCDNWDIYWIESDNYKSDDDYLKRFKDIVKTSFIPSVLNLIHYEIVVIDNKKVLRVDCPRSDELIFLKWELDWAYVRTNPAVEKISGAALVDYARMREKEKIIDKK